MTKNLNDFVISKALEAKKLADEILKMQIELDQDTSIKKKINLRAFKRSHKNLKAASQLLFQNSFELMHLSQEDVILDLSSLTDIQDQDDM